MYRYAPADHLKEPGMEELLSDYERAKQRLQELSETEAYQQGCRHFRSECDRLAEIGLSLMGQIDQLRKTCETDTVRLEYASGCKYLHRGFYAPSPVIHLIVGGVKRGKLLKRVTAKANPAFEYGFNAAGQLLWCNQLCNHEVVSTEYLIYEENAVYAVTVDSSGHLQTVTEEIRENGRLITYSKGLYSTFNGEATCYDFSCEEYTYDKEDIQYCHWHHFMPSPQNTPSSLKELGLELSPHSIYRKDLFFFERADGQLICV